MGDGESARNTVCRRCLLSFSFSFSFPFAYIDINYGARLYNGTNKFLMALAPRTAHTRMSEWMEKLWKFYETFSCVRRFRSGEWIFCLLRQCDGVERRRPSRMWNVTSHFLSFRLAVAILSATAQWRHVSVFFSLVNIHFDCVTSLTTNQTKRETNWNKSNLLVHFDPIRYLSVLLFRMKSLVSLMPRMWMACLGARGVVAAAVDRLCQQPAMPIDGMRNDIDENRPGQCPRAPHRNQTASTVAANPKMIPEPLETFVCNRDKKKSKNINKSVSSS